MIRGDKRAKAGFFVVLALLFASLALVLPAHSASGVLDVDGKINGIDISQLREPIVSERPEISVQGPQEKDKTKLIAKGPGPSYYWSLFSLNNVTDAPLDFVLAVDGQYFAGSGVFVMRHYGPNLVGAVLTKDSVALPVFDAGLMQAIAIHVAPHESTNVAVESREANVSASLWQPIAFQGLQAGHAYFVGLAEGVMVLVLVALLCLFAYRAQPAFLASAFFAVAALFFVEFGVNGFIGKFLSLSMPINILRALAESAIVLALALCAAVYIPSHAWKGWWQRAMIVVGVLALANLGYALAEPLLAALLARWALVLLTGACVVTVWQTRKIGRESVDLRGIFWIALLAWVLVAILMALAQSDPAIKAVQLAIATAVLLIALSAAMVRHLMAHGLSARPFIVEANLRSLALSAGKHIMWDWLPEHEKLEISSEFERNLDLPVEAVPENRVAQFYACIHPLDLATYKKLAERTDLQPSERVQLELRLQHGNGSYHWYDLQARAVPGPDEQVERCIGTLTNIGRLKNVEERLAYDALQDGVSGLPNKALFVDRVNRGLGTPGALPLRVMVVDIDRFKTLNEGLGQDVGDRILKITADRLVGLVDENETVARMNGGQFALECAETMERGDFSLFAGDVQALVAAPIKHGPQQIVLSASIGISMPGKIGTKAQDLIDQATVGMLEARSEGGARTEFYHDELKDDRAEQLSLESDLRKSLSQNEIVIYYQPIVELATLHVVGFEALARWHHPRFGLLPPADFIEVAETAGMMHEIGQFMMAGAARQLGIWQRVHMRGKPFFVSVNVSATQLSHADFPARVQQLLLRENLVQGSLKIEITETVVMRQPERSARLLQQLKAMGVGLACDDFGTGFSSLSSLRDFPFDTLKLDRSFIALEDFDERNGKIIMSITTLAQSLGMTVVGEGIETQGQIDRLASLGCELGQGFLISEPETAESASARLTQMLLGRHLNAPATMQIEDPEPLEQSPPSYFYEKAPRVEPQPQPPVQPSLMQPMFAEELPSIFSMPSANAQSAAKRSKPRRKAPRKRRR